MNTLLIPTDFSPIADNALQYAIDMAKKYQFDILLYNVVQLSTPDFSHLANVDDFSNIIEEVKKKMDEKVALLQNLHPEITFSCEVETGLLIDCINDKCNQINPIAMLMGITGSGTGMDKLIGSNAILAMKHIKHPVIIVPKDASFKSIENICLACDLKNVLTSTPLIEIKVFTKLFNARLNVLNIDYKNRNFSAQTSTELQNLEYILEEVNHELHFIENENVSDAINDFISTKHMDMLIMIPKKHSFFESLFHKSKSKEMAYQSHIPILALHQD
ncbi:MAG: universal stress protein [Bacteroidetes bacterium]|nr:universal stress protein [Bacteroidota bacterium]